jgi:excisionase family DNA binding protein
VSRARRSKGTGDVDLPLSAVGSRADQVCGDDPDYELTEARVERLLTAAEAARLLGIKESWLYAEARANRIPHVRLGRYVRFRHESLERWAREHERGSNSGTSS